MEFSRQEYSSGLSFPSPGDLTNPEMEPGSPTLQADFLPSEPPGNPKNVKCIINGSPIDRARMITLYYYTGLNTIYHYFTHLINFTHLIFLLNLPARQYKLT